MPLTQFQIIQSLAEACSWFEKEKSWGAPAQELRHLTSRIGELYVALLTNGRLAPDINQRGYDVISRTGEKISVKTVTSATHVDFNPNTLKDVDRVIILKFDQDELEVDMLYDASVADASTLMTAPNAAGKASIYLSKIDSRSAKPRPNCENNERHIAVTRSVFHNNFQILEMENGSVVVQKDGKSVGASRPFLRQIAKELSLPVVNTNGNALNTRQLGTNIIEHLSRIGIKA